MSTMSLSGRVKFAVSLSPDTAAMVGDLRQWTDCDTDSEVFRNAIRRMWADEKAKRAERKMVRQAT